MNTGADIARTYPYMSWRKNSMDARAKHCKRSLKKLRRQEAQGATIKTVEIGEDFEAMLAPEDELKNIKSTLSSRRPPLASGFCTTRSPTSRT